MIKKARSEPFFIPKISILKYFKINILKIVSKKIKTSILVF